MGKNRGLVIAFNKAFPEDESIRLARIESGNTLAGLRVEISDEYALGRARQAVECQAILHSPLALMLTANGFREPTAKWVTKSLHTWPSTPSDHQS